MRDIALDVRIDSHEVAIAERGTWVRGAATKTDQLDTRTLARLLAAGEPEGFGCRMAYRW